MNIRRFFCILFNHRYCKCGWCKRHPICLDCYYDKSCLEYHKDLETGMRCQDTTYELLEMRSFIK